MLYFNIFGEETRPSDRKVSYVSETISQSAQGVSQIAEKSSDAAAKTTEGYELLRESRDSIVKLGTIIERFRL